MEGTKRSFKPYVSLYSTYLGLNKRRDREEKDLKSFLFKEATLRKYKLRMIDDSSSKKLKECTFKPYVSDASQRIANHMNRAPLYRFII